MGSRQQNRRVTGSLQRNKHLGNISRHLRKRMGNISQLLLLCSRSSMGSSSMGSNSSSSSSTGSSSSSSSSSSSKTRNS
jgi:hypothetical protein